MVLNLSVYLLKVFNLKKVELRISITHQKTSFSCHKLSSSVTYLTFKQHFSHSFWSSGGRRCIKLIELDSKDICIMLWMISISNIWNACCSFELSICQCPGKIMYLSFHKKILSSSKCFNIENNMCYLFYFILIFWEPIQRIRMISEDRVTLKTGVMIIF